MSPPEGPCSAALPRRADVLRARPAQGEDRPPPGWPTPEVLPALASETGQRIMEALGVPSALLTAGGGWNRIS